MCTYIYNVHICIHVHKYIRMYVPIRTYMYVCIYVFIFIFVCTFIICTNLYLYVCMVEKSRKISLSPYPDIPLSSLSPSFCLLRQEWKSDGSSGCNYGEKRLKVREVQSRFQRKTYFKRTKRGWGFTEGTDSGNNRVCAFTKELSMV